MAYLEHSKLFASPKMDTRIKSANVQSSERWLGCIAEENRIRELKAKCQKKGLNFEEEEAKYQAKLAEQKAKAEAKAAKKSRK